MNYLMRNNMNQNNMTHFIPNNSLNENNKFNLSGFIDYKKKTTLLRVKGSFTYELGDRGISPKQNLIFKVLNGLVVNLICPINIRNAIF